MTELAERRQVEVVLVHVRDQDGVDRVVELGTRARVAPDEPRDAVSQQRIGEDADIAQVDQDRRMAKKPNPPDPAALTTLLT